MHQPTLQQESIFIPVNDSDTLHLKRFFRVPEGPPVLMIHGSMENGKIFYSDSGKGLAPYLAEKGFDVYVGDLRGHGLSQPPISASSKYGQHEAITEDIPSFAGAIRSRRGNIPQYWIAHSWGGVLLLAAFARLETLRNHVKAMVFFASKRTIRVQNWEKWYKIDLFWNRLARLLIWKNGYLPTKSLGIGSDNETDLFHLHTKIWVKSRNWVDPQDGFDYGKNIMKADLPPVLYLAGDKDRYLGHPSDVRDLMNETFSERAKFRLLPGYGHIDILTSPRATAEHFEEMVSWMRSPS